MTEAYVKSSTTMPALCKLTIKSHEQYRTDRFPNRELVILTCMDTRLMELLPKALGVGNGDVKIIKNAGAIVSHPFGSIMRTRAYLWWRCTD